MKFFSINKNFEVESKDLKAEEKRLEEADKREKNWKRWGCYVSERAWGTVREDYSADGAAWDYFPFEQAHLKSLSLERRRNRRNLRPSAENLFCAFRSGMETTNS